MIEDDFTYAVSELDGKLMRPLMIMRFALGKVHKAGFGTDTQNLAWLKQAHDCAVEIDRIVREYCRNA